MRKLSSLVFLGVLLLPVFTIAQISIAVLEFKGRGISQTDSEIFTDRFRTEIFNTHRYKVMERDVVNKILDEQKFQLSGLVSDESAVKIGELIGVEQIIVGSVDRMDDLYSVSVRLISIESGQILRMSAHDFEGSKKELLRSGMMIAARELAGLSYKPPSTRVLHSEPPKSKENVNIRSKGIPYSTKPEVKQDLVYEKSFWGPKNIHERGSSKKLSMYRVNKLVFKLPNGIRRANSNTGTLLWSRTAEVLFLGLAIAVPFASDNPFSEMDEQTKIDMIILEAISMGAIYLGHWMGNQAKYNTIDWYNRNN
jgi:TolB-like protein